MRDAVGFRIVCRFVSDIYDNIEHIKALPGITVVEEKDYIRQVKPNGYRSYHMILEAEAPYEDTLAGIPAGSMWRCSSAPSPWIPGRRWSTICGTSIRWTIRSSSGGS